MRDITYKQNTHRTARVEGFVHCSADSILKIENNEVPKGNIFDIARCAGMMGAKQTPNFIPHCHPVMIDGLDINFEIVKTPEKTGIQIRTFAQSIGRTGIEIEALSATSITALAIYDVLKYFKDESLEITDIKLTKKTGGKTDKLKHEINGLQVALVVASSEIKNGVREDKVSDFCTSFLESKKCEIHSHSIVESGKEVIKNELKELVDQEVPFVFVVGGTGIGRDDNTHDAIAEFIDEKLDGISEAIRDYSYERTPISFLSRLIAGTKNNTFIISIPGSSNGAKEALQAIVPAVFKGHWMKRS